MIENWRNIEDYQGYQVSDTGLVRTHDKVSYTKFHGKRRWRDIILVQKTDKSGYKRVILWKDGKPKTFQVHRLVAQAFIPNDNPLNDCINHIDENPSNNNVNNLEWCDRDYNNKYKSKTNKPYSNYTI